MVQVREFKLEVYDIARMAGRPREHSGVLPELRDQRSEPASAAFEELSRHSGRIACGVDKCRSAKKRHDREIGGAEMHSFVLLGHWPIRSWSM